MRVALTAPYRPTRIGHEGQLDLRTAIGGKRMFNYNQAYWNTLEPIEKLEEEIRLISPQLVAQTWGGPLHGLPYTLSGYMMVCFSHIDLVSCYFEAPPRSRGQTPRMVDFMTQYIARDREANRVAVQLWRHTLMHTARPRYLLDTATGMQYWWLLHWHEHLPREQHYTFTVIDKRKILNIALVYLIEDLKSGFTVYLSDLSSDVGLQEKYEKVDADLRLQEFSSR